MMTRRTGRAIGPQLLFLALLLLLLLQGVVWSDAVATGTVTVADTDPAQGVAGVMVSDGVSNITRTNADGAYTLALAENARFVMVINPPGYESQMSFHQRLPEQLPEQMTVNFTLQPSQRPMDAPFSFAQVTDNHGSSVGQRQLVIAALNAMPDRPAFLIDTGDLAFDSGPASNRFMETYGRELAMPYFPVIGNHDVTGGAPFSGYEFESLYGPWYYAWFYGEYLFVGLPWSWNDGTLDGAAQWVERLLTMNRETENAHVVVYFHHWDSLGRTDSAQLNRFVNLFRDFQVHAAFMGHWHAARAYDAYGIACYMSRAPRMGGNRDLAPGCFRLVTAHPDGTLRSECRPVGHSQSVSMATSAVGTTLPRSPQPLVVNAYDTAYTVRSVSASVHDAQTQRLLQQVDLAGSGGISWIGQLMPAAGWPAQVRLSVNVVDERDETWPASEQHFEIADEALPDITSGADWPMLQQNPERTGVSPDAGIEPPLRLAWAYATGSTFGFNSPIVVDGSVYIGAENNHEPSAAVPAVFALDATTGELQWTHSRGGRSVRGTLAGSSQAVCAQADDGMVFALDPESGSVLWEQSDLVTGPPWQEMFTASPVVRGSTLMAGAGAALGAYDLQTGRLLWRQSLTSIGGRRVVMPSPALGGENVISHWINTHALSLQSGDELWQFDDPTQNTITPTVSGGRVIVGLPVPDARTQTALAALDLTTGERLWTMSEPLDFSGQRLLFVNPYTSPVATEDRIYAFDDRNLYAIDLENGEVLWTLELPVSGRHRVITGSAALSGDYLFLAQNTGTLTAVNVATQQIAWSYELGTRIDSSPAISGNALYIAGRDGTVYAFVAGR